LIFAPIFLSISVNLLIQPFYILLPGKYLENETFTRTFLCKLSIKKQKKSNTPQLYFVVDKYLLTVVFALANFSGYEISLFYIVFKKISSDPFGLQTAIKIRVRIFKALLTD